MRLLEKTVGMLLSMLLIFSLSGYKLAEPNEPSNVLSNAKRLDQQRVDFLDSLNINSLPVDLKDLEAVTRVYLDSLVSCGKIWDQSWKTPSEIPADQLIEICAYNNLLDLPRDFEGIYKPGHEYAPASQVEAAVKKFFDVKSSYLKTSKWYQPQNNTYLLIGGFGGGVWAKAMSAKHEDDKIIIEVGLLYAINERELKEMGEDVAEALKSPDKIITKNAILVPCGTLIVEHKDKKPIQYCSYKIKDGFLW